MSEPEEQVEPANHEITDKPKIPLRRRVTYAAIIYAIFLLILVGVEVITRLTLPHQSSLDLFVSTPQQITQVADAKQSSAFEGDPLLLWRLRPNLDRVVWDFTVVSTNAQHIRANYPTKSKPSGTLRIVCLGDSVTFGYRVPVVWPDKPNEYDRESLPYPMLLEKELRAANPKRQIEAFPMAVPGYTSRQGLAWLRRDIDYFDPDLLIVSFGWNDVSVSDVPDREAIRTDWYPVAVRWLIDHSQAFAHARHWWRSRKTPVTGQRVKPVPRASVSEYTDNLNAIVELVRSRGTGVIVMGAPYRDSKANPAEAELMTSYRAALRSRMQQQQVPYLEILELTEAAETVNQGLFGETIHPNHIGHRLMASELLKLMARNKILGEMNVPNLVP